MAGNARSRKVIYAAIGFVAAAAVAPLYTPADAPASRPAELPVAANVDGSHAYLLEVPGIAGETQLDYNLLRGLKDGGFQGHSEIYDWTGEKKGIDALTNRERNAAEAQKIADKIVALRKADPKAQILITAHSAGTGLIVFALEKLPPTVMVDGVVLLSPALSQSYDLSSALAHVRGKLYCFSSTLDFLVLGLGTRVFGTIDGKKEESAGRVGFAEPANAASPKEYTKLVACPYDRAWIRFGNIGDHVSVMSRPFSEHILAPLVLSHLPGGGGPMTRPVVPVGPIKLPATRPGD